jgi:hypothetical protein
MAVGLTQPLTENGTTNLPGGKGRPADWPARKTDNLTAMCEQIFKKKCGSLDISQPHGPKRSVTVISLPLFKHCVTCQETVTNKQTMSAYVLLKTEKP